MWVAGYESAKYWLGVLNEIKNCDIEDIMIVSVNGLTGFGDAIHAVFPEAEIQRCIMHQIRYFTKFISYKDIKSFMKDLKLVYKADTEELALSALWTDWRKPGARNIQPLSHPGETTGLIVHVFQVPVRDKKADLYHEFDREFQPSVS